MNNKIIGRVYLDGYEEIYFENETVEIKNNEENKKYTDKEYFKDFAITNNSPWSLRNENWIIRYDDNEDAYLCSHYIIGYDMIESELYAYGDTEVEALQNCIKFFREFQEKWNPEGECF